MIGKPFDDLKLERKKKVKTFSSMKNSIKICNDEITVNPTQLFNRIACTIESSTQLEGYMKYELAPQCPSLFDEVSMRKGTKSALASILLSHTPEGTTIPEHSHFVVDGGHLLHSVIWPRPATYGEVCDMYLKYVVKHYQYAVTVVFDGYTEDQTTKSIEQMRRATSTRYIC